MEEWCYIQECLLKQCERIELKSINVGALDIKQGKVLACFKNPRPLQWKSKILKNTDMSC